MRTLLYKWFKTNSIMLFNVSSLVASFAVTSGLGFAYWWLAARLFPPEAIGFASAAISAMKLLGIVCILGLGTLLIRELPRQPGKEASLISAALIFVGIVGGCIGFLFAIMASYVSDDFQVLRANGSDIALFSLGVSLTTVVLVLDQALIGLLRSDLKLWRNTLFAGAKIVALFVAAVWFSQRLGLSIYATWAVGNGVSLAALAGFALWKGKWTGRIYLPRLGMLRKLGSSALQHHMLNLILQGPNMALPVLVTILISATMNAWFYIAFTLADVVYVFPYALVTVLYAIGSAQPSVLARKARMTIGLSMIACLLVDVLLLLNTKLLLGLFGHSYAEQGVWSMRILVLGAFPSIIKDHYITICRIQDRITRTLLPMTVGALLELGAAALGARLGGLAGLSLGWVLAVCVEAIFMFPKVYQTIRPTSRAIDKEHLQPYTL